MTNTKKKCEVCEADAQISSYAVLKRIHLCPDCYDKLLTEAICQDEEVSQEKTKSNGQS